MSETDNEIDEINLVVHMTAFPCLRKGRHRVPRGG
jgi:hypothetical protein